MDMLQYRTMVYDSWQTAKAGLYWYNKGGQSPVDIYALCNKIKDNKPDMSTVCEEVRFAIQCFDIVVDGYDSTDLDEIVFQMSWVYHILDKNK